MWWLLRVIAFLAILLAPAVGCASQAAPPEPVLSSPIADRHGWRLRLYIISPSRPTCWRACRA